MTSYPKRVIRAAIVIVVVGLALQGSRDVVTRVVFPDHAITFDPLGLLVGKVEAAYIPSAIKSLEYNTVTLTGATSNTRTITSVDTTKCGLQSLGFTPAGGVLDSAMGTRIALTNATTVTAVLQNAGTTTAKFVVICFTPNFIKSIQRGTMTSSTTATITSVSTTKTVLQNLGETITSGNTNMGEWTALTLTNATTVTSTSTVNTATVGWEAWEFR